MTQGMSNLITLAFIDLACSLYADSTRLPLARECYDAVSKVADRHGVQMPSYASFTRELVRRWKTFQSDEHTASGSVLAELYPARFPDQPTATGAE